MRAGRCSRAATAATLDCRARKIGKWVVRIRSVGARLEGKIIGALTTAESARNTMSPLQELLAKKAVASFPSGESKAMRTPLTPDDDDDVLLQAYVPDAVQTEPRLLGGEG